MFLQVNGNFGKVEFTHVLSKHMLIMVYYLLVMVLKVGINTGELRTNGEVHGEKKDL